MANGIYAKAKQAFLEADIDWLVDDIKVCVVDGADYTANLATDEFLSDIPGAAIVATSANLSTKTSTDGVADADDVTFSSVTGDSVEIIVIYKDTGVAATSRLIAYYDVAASGLPVTPNGGNITVSWSNGASRIFAL